MPVDIRVPQLGESVVEATITRWLKKEGDPIAPGEPVVELETDKVNVEVPSERGGILQQISQAEGETVSVGAVLGLISENGAAAAPPPATNAGAASTASSASPNAGTNGARSGDASAVGSGAAEDLAATPVARRFAEDNNLDLHLVKGTGPAGRVTKDDVANYLESRSAAPPAPNSGGAGGDFSSSAPSSPTLPSEPLVAEPPQRGAGGGTRSAGGGTAALSSPAPPELGAGGASEASTSRPEERVRMSRRRQTIATRLVEAQHTAAMLTTFNEVDMSAIMAVRARRKDAFKERYGVGLGFMSFFTKAGIGALKAFPLLNAEIQGTEIVKKQYYDIGIAVGAEEGLVVPVVRDADRKTFAQIEKEIGDLARKARENKLTLPELQGGTFTITNGGVFGSLLSTPILNAPQVGILGMHKIEERPVVVAKEIVVRPMMYLALSYDHRVVDGSEAVRFLVKIKELLEDPESLLLEG